MSAQLETAEVTTVDVIGADDQTIIFVQDSDIDLFHDQAPSAVAAGSRDSALCTVARASSIRCCKDSCK